MVLEILPLTFYLTSILSRGVNGSSGDPARWSCMKMVGRSFLPRFLLHALQVRRMLGGIMASVFGRLGFNGSVFRILVA